MRTSLFALFIIVASVALSAQTSSDSSPASQVSTNEIHIDKYCRVITQANQANPTPKPHYHYNRVVCHLESVHYSHHWEQATQNGKVKRIYVAINEREYLLQDVTDKPVTFVVDQTLPKGWRVDSDPQPSEVTGSIATFRRLSPTGTDRPPACRRTQLALHPIPPAPVPDPPQYLPHPQSPPRSASTHP
jgi:hypothetical protein